MCGVVNNQFEKGLLLSLSVKKNQISEYLAKLQARTCLCQSVGVGVLLKRLNVGSHKQHRTIAQGI